jgi:hypothetical protein
MANYPNRCQHLKINGTQCGSPALRRNRFCFFHKRFQDVRIRLSADRARRGVATFILPVLEDANSIQIALMQVMRLLVSQQIEHKTASLLLYALQTASSNLRLARFSPRRHEVILDPRDAADSPLHSDEVWDDDDFEVEEEEEEELDEVEAEAEAAAKCAAIDARSKVHAAAAARERARQLRDAQEKLRKWSETHPGYHAYIDEDGRVVSEPRKPAASTTTDEVRAEITALVQKNLPALSKTYFEATQEKKKNP